MEKSLFEQMGGAYRQVGDYMLPDLILPDEKEVEIGVWGQGVISLSHYLECDITCYRP